MKGENVASYSSWSYRLVYIATEAPPSPSWSNEQPHYMLGNPVRFFEIFIRLLDSAIGKHPPSTGQTMLRQIPAVQGSASSALSSS